MKSMVVFASVALALTMTAMGAAAQAPVFTKPIRVIVPYPPGDLADIIARLLQPSLQDTLGQPIVIENKPGASGALGLQSALQGANDNRTFVLGQMGSMAVAPISNKQTFDVRTEFVPVAMAYTNYLLIVANPQLPAKSIPELVAYAKAHPGELRVATNGEGGFPHLAMELLKKRTGIDFIHVPYKGTAPAVNDTIGGQVELTIAGFSSLYPQVLGGRLNALAITGKARAESAPAVPTVGESVADYEALGWFGFFARKDTSSTAVAAMNAAVNAALAKPEILSRAKSMGLDTVAGTPAMFAKVWRTDYDKWGQLLRDLNLDAK